jgi:hypothetical protein
MKLINRVGTFSVLAAAVLGLSAPARAVPVTVYDTGMGAIGSADPHFTLFSTTASATAAAPSTLPYTAQAIINAPNPLSYGGANNNPGATNAAVGQWISTTPTGTTTAVPGGYYFYQEAFTIDTTGQVTASGQFAVDDSLTAYVDYGLADQSTLNTNGGGTYGSLTDFGGTSNVLSVGTHYFDFVVFNNLSGPTGLLVQNFAATTVAAPTPEIDAASSMLPIAVALCVLAVAGDKRRKYT